MPGAVGQLLHFAGYRNALGRFSAERVIGVNVAGDELAGAGVEHLGNGEGRGRSVRHRSEYLVRKIEFPVLRISEHLYSPVLDLHQALVFFHGLIVIAHMLVGRLRNKPIFIGIVLDDEPGHCDLVIQV